MSLNILKQHSGIEAETDKLSGSFKVLDSGIYTATIEHAYFDKSSGGALSLNLSLKTEEGTSLKHPLWVTSGNAKGNLTYYTTKDGKKYNLPGYNQANSLSEILTGKHISDLEPESKILNIYDFKARAEIPVKKEVITEFTGETIQVAVLKQLVDKKTKDDASGEYVATGETKEVNEINKMLNKDGLTITEIKEGKSNNFKQQWLDKFEGTVQDKSTKTITAGIPNIGIPNTISNTAENTPKLFG